MLQFNNASQELRGGLAVSALVSTLLLSTPAIADSGPYVGASIGNTTLEATLQDPIGGGNFQFDESDFSWKIYGGFNFDLPSINLAVEGGYRNLGGPSATIAAQSFGIDLSAFDLYGVAGLELGPVTVFGKLGMISWDADLTLAGFDAGSESDQDTAYGIGASFGLGSFQLRGEYEVFDVSDTDDVYMLSAGFVYTF